MHISADSIKVTRPLFQTGEGGAVPTSAHQFRVVRCSRKEVQNVVEKNHYSHSINGIISDYCFMLVYEGKIYGGAIFGSMAMRNQWKKYHTSEAGLVELRRLVCTPEAPKNSESFFIAQCLRQLRKIGIKKVVTYADEEYGHKGIIYRASNFKYEGTTPKGKVILYGGKRYHDKAVRTTYGGKRKPFAEELSLALKTGEAIIRTTKVKHIYTYCL